MAEGSEIDIRMPEKVYTVGDTIRLRIEFTSTVNVEDVRAVFERSDVSMPVSQPPLGVVSFEGTVEESSVVEAPRFQLPRKRSAATLVSLVDRDHAPGSYALGSLTLRTVGGRTIQLEPDSRDVGLLDRFQIQDELHDVTDVTVRVEDEEEPA